MNKAQRLLSLVEGKLLASSPSEEGILKLIGEFYGGGNFSLKKISDKEFEVHNSKGPIEGVRVVLKSGRYRFEQTG